VSQRTREIGIRIALGAQPLHVLRSIVAESAALALAGSAIGVVVALGTNQLLSGLLFGVSPLDVLSLATAVVVLIAAALIATAVPGWRAMRIDPMVALRSD
jgi:ABC-type antimicrobial peptide transport system permease subunit